MNNSNEEMSHYVEIIENALRENDDNKLNESSNNTDADLLEEHEIDESSTEIPTGYDITSVDDGWQWKNSDTTSKVFNSEQEAVKDAQKHFDDNKDHLEEDSSTPPDTNS